MAGIGNRRVEWCIVLALVMAGFTLRVWSLSADGLDHYDEGVYAFSALGLTDASQPRRLYPEQEKFSPPVYIGLVAGSYLLSAAPSDRAAIVVNVLLGTMTIPVLWLVGRRWFGPAAGLIAAALLTFNELHILLSRTALTDTAFSLALLMAVALLAEALQRSRVGWAIAGGAVTGIAWNTKYHGWFAIVIAAIALAAQALALRDWRPSRWMRPIALLATAAAVAALCYLPWALVVEWKLGGYDALARYESTLLSRHWIANLVRQAQMLSFLDGPWTRAAVFIAAAAALAVQPVAATPRVLLAAAVCALAAIAGGGLLVVVSLAALAVPALVRDARSSGAAMTLAWMGLWLVSTPMYRPYFRLVLPGLIAASLGAGACVAAWTAGQLPRRLTVAWQPAVAILLALVVGLVTARGGIWGDPWRPRNSLRHAVVAMAQVIPAGTPVVVLGEPAAAFYLHVSGRPAFDDPSALRALGQRSDSPFVLTGRYARVAPETRDALRQLGDRLAVVRRYPVIPGDLRLLDDFSPEAARQFRTHPTDDFDLTLYRLEAAPQR